MNLNRPNIGLQIIFKYEWIQTLFLCQCAFDTFQKWNGIQAQRYFGISTKDTRYNFRRMSEAVKKCKKGNNDVLWHVPRHMSNGSIHFLVYNLFDELQQKKRKKKKYKIEAEEHTATV